MNATPVPSAPNAATAAVESQAKCDRPSPKIANGAVIASASSWLRNTTGSGPYSCCSGTDTFAAKP